MLTPSQRALLQEELSFNSRDDQFSNDSRYHVLSSGDNVDVVAPCGARTDVINSLLFSEPVAYVPFSMTARSVFNFDARSGKFSAKPSRGQCEHTVQSLFHTTNFNQQLAANTSNPPPPGRVGARSPPADQAAPGFSPPIHQHHLHHHHYFHHHYYFHHHHF